MQSYASLLAPSSQAPWGSCSPSAFHVFRWPFKDDVSPGGCAATLCGWLPQETSYRRRKCRTPHAWRYSPPHYKTQLLPCCCTRRVAVSGVMLQPDTQYLWLESFSALPPVFCCGKERCLPLISKSAKRPACRDLPLLTKVSIDLFTLAGLSLSQWNVLNCHHLTVHPSFVTDACSLPGGSWGGTWMCLAISSCLLSTPVAALFKQRKQILLLLLGCVDSLFSCSISGGGCCTNVRVAGHNLILGRTVGWCALHLPDSEGCLLHVSAVTVVTVAVLLWLRFSTRW